MVLFVFAVLFWMGFEQAGSSLTLFAERNTDNRVLGWSFPSSWYQSVEPIFVVTFAPVFAWAWMALGRHEPSSPASFAWARFFLSVGFLLTAFPAGFKPRARGLGGRWGLSALSFLPGPGGSSFPRVGFSPVRRLPPSGSWG